MGWTWAPTSRWFGQNEAYLLLRCFVVLGRGLYRAHDLFLHAGHNHRWHFSRAPNLPCSCKKKEQRRIISKTVGETFLTLDTVPNKPFLGQWPSTVLWTWWGCATWRRNCFETAISYTEEFLESWAAAAARGNDWFQWWMVPRQRIN